MENHSRATGTRPQASDTKPQAPGLRHETNQTLGCDRGPGEAVYTSVWEGDRLVTTVPGGQPGQRETRYMEKGELYRKRIG